MLKTLFLGLVFTSSLIIVMGNVKMDWHTWAAFGCLNLAMSIAVYVMPGKGGVD